MKKLTQKQQDLRRSKAISNLDKRITKAKMKCHKEIEKAYALYDEEK